MFKKIKLNRAIDRLVEERLFELALDEIEQGEIRRGIWGKALANSEGDEAKARSIYVSYRVEAMKDESQIIDAIADKLNTEQHIIHSPKPHRNKDNKNSKQDEPAKTKKSQRTKVTLSKYIDGPPITASEFGLQKGIYKVEVINKVKNGELKGYQDEHGEWWVGELNTVSGKIDNSKFISVTIFVKETNTKKEDILKGIQSKKYDGFVSKNDIWYINKSHLYDYEHNQIDNNTLNVIYIICSIIAILCVLAIAI